MAYRRISTWLLAMKKKRLWPSGLGCRGWMMMEAMYGVAVISIALVAVVLTVKQITITSSYSDQTTQAVSLAQQGLSGLKTITLADKTTVVSESACGIYQFGSAVGSQTLSLPATTTANGFTVSFALDTDTQQIAPVSSVKMIPVKVTVSWTDASNQSAKSISMSAYFFYYNLSGTTCS